MKKVKEYLWKRIINNIENSEDERLKNNIKAFETKEDLIKYVKFYSAFGFDDMKRISGLSYWIRKEKFHHSVGRLLGDETKAMPDDIYKKLIKYVGANIGEKQKLALEFEGIEGARGEDTVRLKLGDLDFKNHMVKILNRKKSRWYEIPLNKNLALELKKFILKNKSEIKSHNNFIFFSKNPLQEREHISQKYLKTLVYDVLKKLNLNKVYAISYDGRKLYLYSLHSIRGHAATRIHERTKHDLKKVQEFLNHEPSSADTTMLYIERNNKKDLKDIV